MGGVNDLTSFKIQELISRVSEQRACILFLFSSPNMDVILIGILHNQCFGSMSEICPWLAGTKFHMEHHL